MRVPTRFGIGIILLAVIGILGLACGSESSVAIEPPQVRTIHMAAIEPIGTTNVDKEPFPAKALPTGKGYGLMGPDQNGNWEVEAHIYTPGTVVVNEGDTVNLEIIGVDGEQHHVRIDGYGVDTFLKRGEVITVTFVADKPGLFDLICTIHPSMGADIVVLKR